MFWRILKFDPKKPYVKVKLIGNEAALKPFKTIF